MSNNILNSVIAATQERSWLGNELCDTPETTRTNLDADGVAELLKALAREMEKQRS